MPFTSDCYETISDSVLRVAQQQLFEVTKSWSASFSLPLSRPFINLLCHGFRGESEMLVQLLLGCRVTLSQCELRIKSQRGNSLTNVCMDNEACAYRAQP